METQPRSQSKSNPFSLAYYKPIETRPLALPVSEAINIEDIFLFSPKSKGTDVAHAAMKSKLGDNITLGQLRVRMIELYDPDYNNLWNFCEHTDHELHKFTMPLEVTSNKNRKKLLLGMQAADSESWGFSGYDDPENFCEPTDEELQESIMPPETISNEDQEEPLSGMHTLNGDSWDLSGIEYDDQQIEAQNEGESKDGNQEEPLLGMQAIDNGFLDLSDIEHQVEAQSKDESKNDLFSYTEEEDTNALSWITIDKAKHRFKQKEEDMERVHQTHISTMA